MGNHIMGVGISASERKENFKSEPRTVDEDVFRLEIAMDDRRSVYVH